MHLKHIIRFFCVTLFFLHGQGAPSEEQVNLVREEVATRVGQNELNFDGMATVFNEISELLDSSVRLEKSDELKMACSYTKPEVERYARSIVGFDHPAVLERIAYVIDMHDENHNGKYSYKQIRNIIAALKQEFAALEITVQFPSDKQIKERVYKSKYNAKDVETLIFNNLFTE
ncbi:uncharacterized protein LOC126841511 isoform X1 [Adelges cooleyi]|uniref:uncharacterized protein LOC126841511 isoform X1 n=1 Tax=Adelges cooleyi TaxID=133065 RepID=UPI002180191E|nr:uncharacterized protein LOC126841511 isoform X1 [Adelges cooleyi]